MDACTAMALCTAMESLEFSDGQFMPLSPLFNYYYARVSTSRLGPVPLRFALHRALVNGVCPYSDHPYSCTKDNAFKSPTPEAIERAKHHKIGFDRRTNRPGYFPLDSRASPRVDRWRNTLAAGYPVICAIWLQDSYWNGRGILNAEQTRSHLLHAVCVLGFDDEKSVFFVRDSRGTEYTNNGEWPLAYSIVMSSQVHESWAIGRLTYNY